MTAKYSPAPEVEKIAQDLIDKHHKHLTDCSARIRYVFVDKAPKSKGKEVWGTCRKVTGLTAHLEGGSPDDDPFFVVTISEDVWEVLPHDKKIALVDHELCHAWAEVNQSQNNDGEDNPNPIKLGILPHDLEEFSCIVRRHGLWREDVKSFVEAALSKKQKLDDPIDDDDETNEEEDE